MPSIYEKCSCGAELDLRDVHYTQVIAFINRWRDAHKHEHFPQTLATEHYAIDTSRNDSVPLGFTRERRGLQIDPPDVDPDGDDENRKRTRRR